MSLPLLGTLQVSAVMPMSLGSSEGHRDGPDVLSTLELLTHSGEAAQKKVGLGLDSWWAGRQPGRLPGRGGDHVAL